MTELAERVSNMQSAIDEITGGKGSNSFLLIDHTKLANADPLQVECTSSKRMAVKLTERSRLHLPAVQKIRAGRDHTTSWEAANCCS